MKNLTQGFRLRRFTIKGINWKLLRRLYRESDIRDFITQYGDRVGIEDWVMDDVVLSLSQLTKAQIIYGEDGRWNP